MKEKARLKVYEFCKKVLWLDEIRAQTTAYVAAQAFASIEAQKDDRERAERMRESVYQFSKETLGLSEEDALATARKTAFCESVLVLHQNHDGTYQCILPKRHPPIEDHTDGLGTKWKLGAQGTVVTARPE